MNAVTVDQVLSWNPCSRYNRERVTELFADRETLTVLDILALDITADDKLWSVLHNEFFTDEQLHTLACDFAERVVHLCGDDPRPQAAIDAKRAWLRRGEISAAAWAAARDAAWDAARAAEQEWQLERIAEAATDPVAQEA